MGNLLRSSLPCIALLLVAGCEPGDSITPAAPTLAPVTGSMSGYFEVTVSWTAEVEGADELRAADVLEVWFGEIRAFPPTALDERSLSAVVQGHPTAGEVDVVLTTADRDVTFPAAFSYDPPLDPAFDSVVALGASFTQGVQSAVPSDHGTLVSPGARLSGQLGAYLPLPQLVPDLFPSMTVDDIGPAPECVVPSVVSFLGWAATEALQQMTDPDTNEFGFQWARVDPDQPVLNLAVGGLTVSDVVYGPADDDFYRQFLAHIVFDPYGGLYDAVPHSPLTLAEQAEPTLIVSADLYGNDLIIAIVEGNDIDPDEVTPIEDFTQALEDGLARMSATGAEVFLTNVPQPTLVPAAAERKRWLVGQGWTTEEDVDAALAEIDALAVEFNAVMDDVAGQYDNVHVVDLNQLVVDLVADGLPIGDDMATIERFGGLVSLDGLHFSDTGYAVLSNQILEAINAELGTDVPLADLDAIFATDPYAPHNLEAAGLDVDACMAL
jgi:lysophospholipase L1-like esterase